jgi:hypothetical protein
MWWQPFLGEVRMYLRVGDDPSFKAWTKALERREVFVSSGPIVEFSVNGVGPGGVLRLKKDGGEVDIVASLSSPRPLEELEVIRNGQAVAVQTRSDTAGPIHILRIHQRMRIDQSSWLAAYGRGERNQLVQDSELFTFAHTAAVRVLVGDHSIGIGQDLTRLRQDLEKQRDFYRTEAVLANGTERERFTALFDRAISTVESRQTVQDSPGRDKR